MDVRKGLGSVAVDNAALSTSKSGIGLQAVGLWIGLGNSKLVYEAS